MIRGRTKRGRKKNYRDPDKQVSICQRNKLCVALRDWLLDFIQNDATYLYNVKINVNPTNEHLLNNFN